MLPTWLSRFERKPGCWVFVPTSESVEFGKQLNQTIRAAWKSPSFYYHLRRGGHVAALRAHVNGLCFLHLDIKNFFGSINRSRVTRCLKPMLGYVDARNAASMSTVREPLSGKRVLPYGFVQSPFLASLCLARSVLGQELERISAEDGVTLSVYVDDIVVGTNDESTCRAILGRLEEAANASNFAFNALKCEGPAPLITAFNIELAHASLEISAARYSDFLTALSSADSPEQRAGIFAYVSSVNSVQAAQLPP